MKLWTLSVKNLKALLRDPLLLAFELGFPLVLLGLLQLLQKNIPVPLFEIQRITPGIVVFGQSFTALLGATVLAKDKTTALLQRLYTAPLNAVHFILGYTLPLAPIGLFQAVVCYAAALALGLPVSGRLLLGVLAALPAVWLFVALGLLCGSLLNDRQVGGICGALLTNLCGWLAGIWFDVALAGPVFVKIAHALPFYHAVALGQAALSGVGDIWPHLMVVAAWALPASVGAVLAFLWGMHRG